MVCHGDAGRARDHPQGHRAVATRLRDGGYGDFTDADYYWRISEGLPWTAMPAWKCRTTAPRDGNWSTTSAQSSRRRATAATAGDTRRATWPSRSPRLQGKGLADQARPTRQVKEVLRSDIARAAAAFPETGEGWNGVLPRYKPASLHDQLTELNPHDMLMAKLSFGIEDTAMPTYFEWMPFNERWALVKYIVETYPATWREGRGEHHEELRNCPPITLPTTTASTRRRATPSPRQRVAGST